MKTWSEALLHRYKLTNFLEVEISFYAVFFGSNPIPERHYTNIEISNLTPLSARAS